MRSKTKRGLHRFALSLLHYGNSYYIDRVAELEAALARKPRQLQLDMLGEGEIPADWALLIRSILRQRAPQTQLITNARTSLQNGSVLVWLLGDRRLIRDDARLFLRRANPSDEDEDKGNSWKNADAKDSDSASETDPEEADYAKVLQLINEFLPVNELAGRMIDVPVLRQFGLVENEKVDHFLATAFGKTEAPTKRAANQPEEKQTRGEAKSSQPRPVGE
jgi:hypothetical protein